MARRCTVYLCPRAGRAWDAPPVSVFVYILYLLGRSFFRGGPGCGIIQNSLFSFPLFFILSFSHVTFVNIFRLDPPICAPSTCPGSPVCWIRLWGSCVSILSTKISKMNRPFSRRKGKKVAASRESRNREDHTGPGCILPGCILGPPPPFTRVVTLKPVIILS